MGSNLPPGVSVNDPNAPWNENGPVPDGCCRHCDSWFKCPVPQREVDLSALRRVIHDLCPNCGAVMKATMLDETEEYHEGWRKYRDEMEDTIVRYTDLKDIEERTNDGS